MGRKKRKSFATPGSAAHFSRLRRLDIHRAPTKPPATQARPAFLYHCHEHEELLVQIFRDCGVIHCNRLVITFFVQSINSNQEVRTLLSSKRDKVGLSTSVLRNFLTQFNTKTSPMIGHCCTNRGSSNLVPRVSLLPAPCLQLAGNRTKRHWARRRREQQQQQQQQQKQGETQFFACSPSRARVSRQVPSGGVTRERVSLDAMQ